MQTQFHTDKNIDVSDGLLRRVESELDAAVARYRDQITRVDIHLSDVNATKSGGQDKRCMLEARPAGQQPVAVTHLAASPYEACSGAIRRLAALLDSRYGRSDHHKGGESIRHLEVGEGLA